MRCDWCAATIPPAERQGRPRRYCSRSCQARAYRARRDVIPPQLRERDRWVRHDDRKRPLTTVGQPASVTNPDTWASFAAVRRASAGVGLGFVLGDGIGCIDLDHCISGGVIAPWALDIIREHADDAILVERSRSGEGVHIFLPMEEAPGRKVRDGRNIETYSRGRYIAVTGDRIEL